MNYSDLFKTSYPGLIETTIHSHPNYEIIDFEQILKIKFQQYDLFIIDINIKAKIDKELDLKYGKNYIDQFEIQNKLTEVFLDSMKYYQHRIDIRGRYPEKDPENGNNIDEPVKIVKYKGDLVLYNGYHRAAILITKNQKTIMGTVLEL